SHGKKDYHQAIDKVRFQKFLSWSIDKGFLDKRITLDLDRTIRVVPHNIFSRSIRIYLGDTIVKLKKSNFRRYFGRVLFPSNNFKISVNNNKLRVFGQGLGHGVGLCQLGALDLAKKGWDYKRILAHYFPEHELKKFY
ncbi:hypothetical protein OAT67_09715, partial [Bacteriovoracaceae bacterium]|nr:hypothetical protein [Bacteriovoracaceae bacterium]